MVAESRGFRRNQARGAPPPQFGPLGVGCWICLPAVPCVFFRLLEEKMSTKHQKPDRAEEPPVQKHSVASQGAEEPGLQEPTTPEETGAEAASSSEATSPPSPEEIEALRAQAARADEHYDRYLRAVADLDNYRKRAARDREEAVKYANERLLNRLIPVLDSFETALASLEEAPAAVRDGVRMIYNQLLAALQESGLEPIDATGHPFDPSLHEAVSMRETAEVPEGHVAQQLRKGYRLNGRLVRPASVIVARAPQSETASAESHPSEGDQQS